MIITKQDVVWSYAGIFMSLGSNFLLLPFLIYFLRGEELGLWYVFLSIGGIINLFDFGFNPTLARNVAYSWSGAVELTKTDVIFVDNGKPNIILLQRVINTCKRIYLIIALIALIVLLSIGSLYIFHISIQMSGNEHIIAWFIYVFAVFINLYYGYYTTFLRGVGALKQLNQAIVLSRTIQIIISIVLLYLGFGLIGVTTAYLVYGALFRYISKISFYKYEEIGKKLANQSNTVIAEIKETFIVVWHNAWRDGLVSLSSYLSNQATVIIASMFLSLTSTGIYSISLQLITAIGAISGVLYTTYQPALQAAYINNNIEGSKKLMSIVMTVYIFLFWACVFILMFVGIPILNLIRPEVEFSIPVLILISIYTFFLKHHNLYASYISNTNNVPYFKAYIFSSCAGVILATLLIKYTVMGLWGLLIAQIIVQSTYNNWAWPYKVMKTFNINPIEMFRLGITEIIRVLLRNNNIMQKKR